MLKVRGEWEAVPGLSLNSQVHKPHGHSVDDKNPHTQTTNVVRLYEENANITLASKMVDNRKRCLHSSLYNMLLDDSHIDAGNLFRIVSNNC